MISSDQQVQVARSQHYFNKVSLFFYDAILYGVISKYAWGSSIARLDAHYAKYATANHLEVGVGTGFLLNRVRFPALPRLALMDLSAECLAKTGHKVARHAPATYVQNILEPIAHRIKRGTLFGTTVLSKDAHKNLLARPFMWLMNKLGVFNNRDDSAHDLETYLRAHFEVIEFQVIGVTAFFAVKNTHTE